MTPFKWMLPEWHQAMMDYTKQLFGIVMIYITQQWSPLKVTITGDRSVQGLFKKNNANGHLETLFGDRTVLISNHQLYSDWVFLWWIAYTAKVHGNIFIMLKNSLRKLPLLGWGMQNYRFLFLSRSWAQDEKVLTEGLSRINKDSNWPAWLILFPEGTTISKNGVNKSTQYAAKQNPPLLNPQNVLLPRSRGLRFSLEKLHETVEYIHDATIYYEGVPENEYGEVHFSLTQMYVHGVFPQGIQMYWRRYKIADIPWQDEALFEKWIYDRWYEKDLLLKRVKETGSFLLPGEEDEPFTPFEVPVELDQTLPDLFKIIVVPATTALLARLAYRALTIFNSNR